MESIKKKVLNSSEKELVGKIRQTKDMLDKIIKIIKDYYHEELFLTYDNKLYDIMNYEVNNNQDYNYFSHFCEIKWHEFEELLEKNNCKLNNMTKSGSHFKIVPDIKNTYCKNLKYNNIFNMVSEYQNEFFKTPYMFVLDMIDKLYDIEYLNDEAKETLCRILMEKSPFFIDKKNDINLDQLIKNIYSDFYNEYLLNTKSWSNEDFSYTKVINELIYIFNNYLSNYIIIENDVTDVFKGVQNIVNYIKEFKKNQRTIFREFIDFEYEQRDQIAREDLNYCDTNYFFKINNTQYRVFSEKEFYMYDIKMRINRYFNTSKNITEFIDKFTNDERNKTNDIKLIAVENQDYLDSEDFGKNIHI